MREARRLGLPVIALVDTNCDPDEADYVDPRERRRDPLVLAVVRAVADGIAAGGAKVTAGRAAPRRAEPAPAREAEPDGRRRAASPPRAAGREPSRRRAGQRERPWPSPPPRSPWRRSRGGQRERPTISASLVKELRELTGAGMMDCKRALQETDGDLDAAARCCASGAWRGRQARRPGDDRGPRRLDRQRRRAATMVASAARRSPSRRTTSSRRSPSRCSSASHAEGAERGRGARGRAR